MNQTSHGKDDANTTTHFGFQTVDAEEKAGMVGEVFHKVASSYDIMNDAMSLGMHRLWKKRFVNQISPRNHERLLDVAGGTGDIAFALQAAAPEAEITVADINPSMLGVGRDRAINKGKDPQQKLDWVCANAETLPAHDGYYDSYSIAFGIRNVTDIPAALREAYRSLKRGGRFYCLEFSPSVTPALKPVYESYSFNIIPKLGQWIAKDADSYQYLVESIQQFPTPQTFAKMIETAGFGSVKYTPLSGGIVAIHSGWKI